MRGSLAGTMVLVAVAALPAAAADLESKARRLHERAIVVDTHVDAPYALEKKWADVATRGATDHFDIPRALEGGLTAPFFAIYVPKSYAEAGGAAREALDLIDLVQRIVRAHPDRLVAKLFDTLPRHRSVWTRVVDHIEHVIAIAGPGAVGLGTDFDGIQDPPEGLEDVSKLPAITAELLRRGYAEVGVRCVLGGMFLRCLA